MACFSDLARIRDTKQCVPPLPQGRVGPAALVAVVMTVGADVIGELVLDVLHVRADRPGVSAQMTGDRPGRGQSRFQGPRNTSRGERIECQRGVADRQPARAHHVLETHATCGDGPSTQLRNAEFKPRPCVGRLANLSSPVGRARSSSSRQQVGIGEENGNMPPVGQRCRVPPATLHGLHQSAAVTGNGCGKSGKETNQANELIHNDSTGAELTRQ